MIHFKLVEYLRDRGYLKPGIRVMDVGTQNLLFIDEARAVEMVRGLRATPLGDAEMETLRRVCHSSVLRPGERTTFLHELLALTDIEYHSVDVVDGLKTTILDLNFEAAPEHWRGHFDFVLNCGTLEHVINQRNALGFIHDVLKVGGVWFDQPPSVGFLNHGYFNYNPLFYRDIAQANQYELLEAWYSHAGSYPATDARFPIVSIGHLDEAGERAKTGKAPFSDPDPGEQREMAASYNFNALMRKTVDAPLRLPLEVRTTHGPVQDSLQAQYGTSIFDSRSIK